MYLIQVFLPKFNNQGRAIDGALFRDVRRELLEQFSGLTCYLRSPVQGYWDTDASQIQRDELVIYEILTDRLDRDWWHAYRVDLEHRFEQQQVLVRSQTVEQL